MFLKVVVIYYVMIMSERFVVDVVFVGFRIEINIFIDDEVS